MGYSLVCQMKRADTSSTLKQKKRKIQDESTNVKKISQNSKHFQGNSSLSKENNQLQALVSILQHIQTDLV